MIARFEFVSKLADHLNALLEKNPKKAAQVAKSGIIELANTEYRQSFGPLVAQWHDVKVDGVSQGATLECFDVFMGVPLSDEELKQQREWLKSGKAALVRV
jgi:hypothetical protein